VPHGVTGLAFNLISLFAASSSKMIISVTSPSVDDQQQAYTSAALDAAEKGLSNRTTEATSSTTRSDDSSYHNHQEHSWRRQNVPADGYLLEFVRGSYAHTDCPEDLASLLSQVSSGSMMLLVCVRSTDSRCGCDQRRRWMNGAFFALVFALQVDSHAYL